MNYDSRISTNLFRRTIVHRAVSTIVVNCARLRPGALLSAEGSRQILLYCFRLENFSLIFSKE